MRSASKKRMGQPFEAGRSRPATVLRELLESARGSTAVPPKRMREPVAKGGLGVTVLRELLERKSKHE